MSTTGRRPYSSRLEGGALPVSCALLSLGGGKCNGRGAEGVNSSHRQQGNGQPCKGFGAEMITYWAAGEAAKEGEGDQDAGNNPGRRGDADRCRMGGECHPVQEREEREERRAHGARRRSGKQQVDQNRGTGLAHQRAREA